MCVIAQAPEGQHPVYPTIVVPLEVKTIVKEKLNKLGITEYIQISDFHQDIYGVLDYPPTFNWNANIAVKFSEPHKKEPFFQCNITELKEEVEAAGGVISKELMLEDFDNAVETIADYRDCVCAIDEFCVFHATLSIKLADKKIVHLKKEDE